MTKYEQAFGTDWETLGIDTATDRAYAIGLSEVFGEDNHQELQAIYDEMSSAYDRSIVELAYEEGRTKARNMGNKTNHDDMWAALITDERIQEDSEEFKDSDSPKLLNVDSLLDRSDIDSTEAVSRPDFLDQ